MLKSPLSSAEKWPFLRFDKEKNTRRKTGNRMRPSLPIKPRSNFVRNLIMKSVRSQKTFLGVVGICGELLIDWFIIKLYCIPHNSFVSDKSGGRKKWLPVFLTLSHMNVSQILRIKLPFDEVYPLPHYKQKIFKILERLVERHLESNSKTGWSCKMYFFANFVRKPS